MRWKIPKGVSVTIVAVVFAAVAGFHVWRTRPALKPAMPDGPDISAVPGGGPSKSVPPSQPSGAPRKAEAKPTNWDAHKGKPVPDFTVRDINGKEHKLSDYRGKVLLLNFWSPH